MKFSFLSLCITALMSVPANLQLAYKKFRTEQQTDTTYVKPLSAKFTTTFTGTYPSQTPITAHDNFLTLGFPTTRYKKAYERTERDGQHLTHTVRASGHIQCKAGDTQCNNALYALSYNRDFTQCMHAALSHPEIPRTQRCASLFAALGRYGIGEHVLRQPLCSKAWWTFDVTLDED